MLYIKKKTKKKLVNQSSSVIALDSTVTLLNSVTLRGFARLKHLQHLMNGLPETELFASELKKGDKWTEKESDICKIFHFGKYKISYVASTPPPLVFAFVCLVGPGSALVPSFFPE